MTQNFKTAEEALHALFNKLEKYLKYTHEDGSNYFIDGLSTENMYNGDESMEMTISRTEDGWELEQEVE